MSAGRVPGSVSVGGVIGGPLEMTVCSVGAMDAELPLLAARGAMACCEIKSTSTDDELAVISSAKGHILTYGRSDSRLAVDERPRKKWENKPSE